MTVGYLIGEFIKKSTYHDNLFLWAYLMNCSWAWYETHCSVTILPGIFNADKRISLKCLLQ